MRFGIRKPSIKKSIKARTTGKLKRTLKASINPLYGKKGMGLINNPKKSLYNRVYKKSTVGISDIYNNDKKRKENLNINSFDNVLSSDNWNNDNKHYNEVFYQILDKNNVIINGLTYSRGAIKFFKNCFAFFTFFIGIGGILLLPIGFGIIFILFAIVMFFLSKKYKEIYNEMISYDDSAVNK